MPKTNATSAGLPGRGGGEPPRKKQGTVNKLERVWNNMSPLTKTKPKQHNPIYIVTAKEGIVMAFITKPDDMEQQAFTGKIFQKFRNDSDFAMRHFVHAIMPRRMKDVMDKLPNVYNEAMKASKDPSNDFMFNMFVRIYDNVDDANDREVREAWGKILENACNEIAAAEFAFPTTFRFRADLTNLSQDLPAANTYLLNRDVIKLMDYSYPVDRYSRQQQADNLTEAYFGDDSQARNFILSFDYGPAVPSP
jgi:hypothetical protein